MKTRLPSFFVLSLFLTSASATAKGPSAGRAAAEKLFIIVANGLRYDDALGNKNHLYTENIWTKLRPLGTIFTNFHNTALTYPIPAQASLLTGVWHFDENPLSDTIRPAFPTIFEYWKRTKSDAGCYFAANKGILINLSFSGCKEYGKTYAPVFSTNATNGIDTSFKINTAANKIENAIYGKALSYIFTHHPSFVYLNLDSGRGDEAHLYTHECMAKDKKDDCGGADLLNAYYESIIMTDELVCDLWNRIQSDDFYKNRSVFIVLGVHGRHTDDFHGFGDNCRGCQQLNCLIVGPGVKKDFVSKKKRTLIDVCPTVGVLCDFPTPFAKGKIMKEILE